MVTCKHHGYLIRRLDGIKDLVERRRMEQYLSQHLPDEEKDNTVLCTIQGGSTTTIIGVCLVKNNLLLNEISKILYP